MSEESCRLVAERNRARTEARDKALAAVGLTRAEAAIFTTLYYQIIARPERVPHIAAVEDGAVTDTPVTEAECRVALDACLAKGWVQVFDDATRDRIAADLRAGGYLGPIYGGLPEVGCVDFTEAGAALWRRLWEAQARPSRPPSVSIDGVREMTAWYFRSRKTADESLEAFRAEDDFFAASEPVAIGPWRAQWWRRFPKGYRVDVETRRQWQGRGRGGESTDFDRKSTDATIPRLRAILARHNVTPVQWAFLVHLEFGPLTDGPRVSWWFPRFGEHEFGVAFTEDEYRDAREACLRNGCVKVVDHAVVEEVRALLRDDPTYLALPTKAVVTPGTIDFTLVGAALYHTILGEWYGHDWEDRLRASNVYYWEEHHYCESESGFDAAPPFDRENRVALRASRVVPIGPWCVAWWQRFPAGFRLELEFGTEQ